jgi:hypothetical protein
MVEAQIGWVELKEKETFRKGYEVACWYKMVECEPQKVPLYADLDEEGKPKRDAWWKYHGVCVKAYFPVLYGGVKMTSGDSPKDIGQPETIGNYPYAYSVAECIATKGGDWKNERLTLSPEYEITSYEYVSSVDNETKTMYNIRKRRVKE